jgi:hypothetical protein
MSLRLIHITPELPPTVGGVADYTIILSRRLVEVSNETVEPVLVHAGKQRADAIEVDFPVVNLSGKHPAAALSKTIQRLVREHGGETVVLLEYSGYEYATRGIPISLVRSLQQVREKVRTPVLTVFHEINASGPLWSSAFWLSPVQKWIARRLVEISCAVFVNRPGGEKKLRQWSSAPETVALRPVFSNVGEPDAIGPYEDRENYAVVFCGRQEKKEIYFRHDMIGKVDSKEKVGKIIDIGPPLETLPESPISIRKKGIQSAETISRWLRGARLGFAHRRLDLLTKSGVVAAYLAHGVPPVIIPNGTGKHPPALTHGKTYVRLDRHLSSANWPRLSRQGYAWYQKNAHSRGTADLILNKIESATQGS